MGCSCYAGDLLRKEVASGTTIGKMAEDLMKKGELVPEHISLTLLKRAMLSSGAPVILIDGFPRSMEQVGNRERGQAGGRVPLVPHRLPGLVSGVADQAVTEAGCAVWQRTLDSGTIHGAPWGRSTVVRRYGKYTK